MHSAVFFQMRRISSPVRTHGARVRFLSSMNAHVLMHARHIGTTVLAPATLVFLLTHVATYVRNHFYLLKALKIAVMARKFVRFDASPLPDHVSVHSVYVRRQMILRPKTFPTVRTRHGFFLLSRMDQAMSL